MNFLFCLFFFFFVGLDIVHTLTLSLFLERYHTDGINQVVL